MSKFTPSFLVAWAATADWGMTTTKLLRLFDCFEHDIANSHEEVADFCDLVDELFIKGEALFPACLWRRARCYLLLGVLGLHIFL